MFDKRILVGVTTYEKKDYIFDDCLKHIAMQQYPSHLVDVVIVDNSPISNYYMKLIRRGYKRVYRVSRGKNSREALTNSQNKIRNIFMAGNYDYLLFVESDLLIRPDTVTRLLSYNIPVAGSTYYIGTGNVKVPCIFVDDIVEGGFRGTRPIGIKKDEFGRKYHDASEVEKYLSQQGPLIQCHGCGFGCTLIKRDVIEKVGSFWCDERMDDKHSDVYFYLDCARNHIPVFVDISVIVPHYPTDWATVKDR